MISSVIKPYLDILNQQRDWSWTVIGIIYLIGGLTLRSWFLKPLTTRSKTLSKKYNQELKAEYLKRAIGGWIFFFISFFLVVISWNNPYRIQFSRQTLFLSAGGTLALSILLHVLAFGTAAMTLASKHLNK